MVELLKVKETPFDVFLSSFGGIANGLVEWERSMSSSIAWLIAGEGSKAMEAEFDLLAMAV